MRRPRAGATWLGRGLRVLLAPGGRADGGSPHGEFRDSAAAEISWVQWSRLCWNLLWSRHKLIITLLLEAASCIINVCWRQEGRRLEKLLLPGGPPGRGTLCAGVRPGSGRLDPNARGPDARQLLPASSGGGPGQGVRRASREAHRPFLGVVILKAQSNRTLLPL